MLKFSVCYSLKNAKLLKNHMYISIHSLWHEAQN